MTLDNFLFLSIKKKLHSGRGIIDKKPFSSFRATSFEAFRTVAESQYKDVYGRAIEILQRV